MVSNKDKMWALNAIQRDRVRRVSTTLDGSGLWRVTSDDGEIVSVTVQREDPTRRVTLDCSACPRPLCKHSIAIIHVLKTLE